MTAELLRGLIAANLAASAGILLVFALRQPTRRLLGARLAYGLWLAPILAAASSLLPAHPRELAPISGAPVRAMAEEAMITVNSWANAPAGPAPLDIATPLLVSWFVGAVVFVLITLMRQRATVRRLGRLRPAAGERLWRAERPAMGPALIGIWSPRLVVPADFEGRYDEAERSLVLAHEAAHLAAGHTRINALVALLCAINWFNPLVHLAARFARVDQELACDAAVVARFPGERRVYAEALLKTQLAPASLPLGCYWPMRSPNLLRERIQMLARETPGAARKIIGLCALVGLGSATALASWAAEPNRAALPIAAAAFPAIASTSAPPPAATKVVAKMPVISVQAEWLPIIPQEDLDRAHAKELELQAKGVGDASRRWDEFQYVRYLSSSRIPDGYVVEMSTADDLSGGVFRDAGVWRAGAPGSLSAGTSYVGDKPRYSSFATYRVGEDNSITVDTALVVDGLPMMAKDVKLASGQTAYVRFPDGHTAMMTPVLRPATAADSKIGASHN